MSEATGSSMLGEKPAAPAPAAGTTSTEGTATGTTTTTTSTAPASWRDGLPEALRKEASLSNFDSIETLAKSYVNAQKLIGADKIAIPGKNAGDDAWKQVYSKLGLPESVDKYDIKVQEGQAIDKDFFSAMKAKFHEAGVLPSQAQKVVDWYNKTVGDKQTEAQTAQKAELEQGISNLKKEWGNGFENQLNLARAAVEEFGGDELRTYLDKSGLGNRPEVIKLMAKIGESLSEDKIPGAEGSRSFGMTPDQARQEWVRLSQDPAYTTKNHVGHDDAIRRGRQLFEAMYPQS